MSIVKRFKIGLKLWSTDVDMISEAERIYEQGHFDYIELYIVPGTYKKNIECWTKVKIPFLIHCTHSIHGFNLALEEKFESNFKIFSEVKSFADALKCKFIVFHPGIEGKLEDSIKQTNILADKRLLVENKPYVSMSGRFCRGSTYEELQKIIIACNVGFCLDIAHIINTAFHLGKDYLDYIKNMFTLDPKVIHISDGEIKERHDSHLNIGFGEFDFKKILKIIASIDTRYWTIETDRSGGGLDYFISDVDKIQRIMIDGQKNKDKKK